jgi:hypothetical protein
LASLVAFAFLRFLAYDIALVALATTNTPATVSIYYVWNINLGNGYNNLPILAPAPEYGAVLNKFLQFPAAYSAVDILEVLMVFIYSTRNGSPPSVFFGDIAPSKYGCHIGKNISG